MRLMFNSLSGKETPLPPVKLPTSLTYVTTRTTTGGHGTNHVQGFVIDEPNNRVFIAYTNNIVCYAWDTLAYLYQTGANPQPPLVNDIHYGDIAYLDGKIYVGYSVEEPRLKMELSADDLTILRQEIQTEIPWPYPGAMATNSRNEVWMAWSRDLEDETTRIRQLNLSTLQSIAPDTSIQNVDIPNIFQFAIQSLAFKPSDFRVACLGLYLYDTGATDGTGIVFADVEADTYVKFRMFQKTPIDYGISFTTDNKFYIVQKSGGTSNLDCDILEFDVGYD